MLSPTIPSDQSPEQPLSPPSSHFRAADNIFEPLWTDASSATVPTDLGTSSTSYPTQSHPILSGSMSAFGSAPDSSLRSTLVDLRSYNTEGKGGHPAANLPRPTHCPSGDIGYGPILDSDLFLDTFDASLALDSSTMTYSRDYPDVFSPLDSLCPDIDLWSPFAPVSQASATPADEGDTKSESLNGLSITASSSTSSSRTFGTPLPLPPPLPPCYPDTYPGRRASPPILQHGYPFNSHRLDHEHHSPNGAPAKPSIRMQFPVGLEMPWSASHTGDKSRKVYQPPQPPLYPPHARRSVSDPPILSMSPSANAFEQDTWLTSQRRSSSSTRRQALRAAVASRSLGTNESPPRSPGLQVFQAGGPPSIHSHEEEQIDQTNCGPRGDTRTSSPYRDPDLSLQLSPTIGETSIAGSLYSDDAALQASPWRRLGTASQKKLLVDGRHEYVVGTKTTRAPIGRGTQGQGRSSEAPTKQKVGSLLDIPRAPTDRVP